MSINSYLGSLFITFFLCLAIIANVIELVKITKEYLKKKKWIE